MILWQFPTMGRPEKFISVLDRWIATSSGQNRVVFNINCDYGDHSMNNVGIQQEIRERDLSSQFPHVAIELNYDRDTTKIGSVNAHANDVAGWDIVVVVSDDMVPDQNWDIVITEVMSENFPDLDGAVHSNDGSENPQDLITLSILGRKLYESFGYIYHPDYKVLYCDNEFTDVVYQREKVVYVDKIVAKHAHYSIDGNENSGEVDYTARKTLALSGRDQKVYETRRKMGYPSYRITND